MFPVQGNLGFMPTEKEKKSLCRELDANTKSNKQLDELNISSLRRREGGRGRRGNAAFPRKPVLRFVL